MREFKLHRSSFVGLLHYIWSVSLQMRMIPVLPSVDSASSDDCVLSVDLYCWVDSLCPLLFIITTKL